MRLGDAHEWRARLSSHVFSSVHPTVIAAPPGFGVATIAAHVQSSEQAVPATVLDLDSADPSRLGIEKLLRKHVVFTGREIPNLAQIPNAQLIDHQLLRFTEREAILEAERLGVDESVARSIHLFTRGWPEYFCACLDVARQIEGLGPSEAYDRLHQGPHLQPLIDACTIELSSSDRHQVGQLTHFTKISPGIISSLLGTRGLARIQRAGLPIVETHPGWYEILEPVRSSLRSKATLDEQTARSLAPELVADAGMVAGARILLTAGQPAAAATALRSVPVHKLDEGSQSLLLSLLRTVLDTEKDDGSLHLRLARVHHNHGDLISMRRTLQQAATIAEDQLRPDLEIEAKAELLLLDLPDADEAAVRARHRDLLEQARDHASSLAQIRLREVEVILAIQNGDLQGMYQAATNLESVANDWELVGEPARASSAIRVLASSALFHFGSYARAIDALNRACELANGQPQASLKSLTLLERNYAMLGDVELATKTSQKVDELLDGAGLPWIDAYHGWSAMILSGYRQDRDAVISNQRRAETLLGSLFSHPTGAVFLADAAVAAAAAGDYDAASAFLDRALARTVESPVDVGCAAIYVAALRRDPGVREMAAELRQAEEIPLEREWRIDLAVALSEGRTDTEYAEEGANRYGLGTLYDTMVRCFTATPNSPKVRLQLLGNFVVQASDGERVISGGKATELVKFLGVRLKAVPVDVVIEHLWGDVPTDVGLRRLKNVVSRARNALGQDAVERRGQSIGLSTDVSSDLIEVRDLLRRLRTHPDDVAAATAVVDMYQGPLLELDVYHDWVDSERRSLEVAVSSALELVVDHGEASASWALDALRRLAPADERPFMAVADLAHRHDDVATLQLALDEVRRVCDDLEVRLPTGFDRLAARISVSAGPDSDSSFEGS